jgi:nucleoside-diphosphate-sugar epimerase
MFFGIPRNDIEEIYTSCSHIWPSLENSNILVMGGTGFVGKWLVAALGYAQLAGSNLKITILSREPSIYAEKFSAEGIKISWIKHDVAKDSEINSKEFTHIINAATPSSAKRGAIDPSYVYDSIVLGNEQILNAAHATNFRYLFLSSGAVAQLETSEPIFERQVCETAHLDTLSTAYSHGKRFAELDIASAIATIGLNGQALRLYAFAGPGLPLDQHFAAGNFMRDFLDTGYIEIKGNPETQRSYMYPTDLAIHILNALISTETNPQEVGSSEVVTIKELAGRICGDRNTTAMSRGDSKQPISSYFPKSETLLGETISLDESIKRWKAWLFTFKN